MNTATPAPHAVANTMTALVRWSTGVVCPLNTKPTNVVTQTKYVLDTLKNTIVINQTNMEHTEKCRMWDGGCICEKEAPTPEKIVQILNNESQEAVYLTNLGRVIVRDLKTRQYQDITPDLTAIKKK